MGTGISRGRLYSRPEMKNGVFLFALLEQHGSEIILRLRVLRRELHGLFPTRNRFILPPLILESLAKTVISEVVVGNRRDGVAEKCFAVSPISQLNVRAYEAGG